MEQDQENIVAVGMVQIWFFIITCCTGRGICQSTPFSSLFHQMTPTKCFTMSYTDKFVVHHTQAVEKSIQEDLLSDSMNQKFFFPSDILAYHLKD